MKLEDSQDQLLSERRQNRLHFLVFVHVYMCNLFFFLMLFKIFLKNFFKKRHGRHTSQCKNTSTCEPIFCCFVRTFLEASPSSRAPICSHFDATWNAVQAAPSKNKQEEWVCGCFSFSSSRSNLWEKQISSLGGSWAFSRSPSLPGSADRMGDQRSHPGPLAGGFPHSWGTLPHVCAPEALLAWTAVLAPVRLGGTQGVYIIMEFQYRVSSSGRLRNQFHWLIHLVLTETWKQAGPGGIP